MRRILAVSLLLAGVVGGCDFEPTGSTGSSRPAEARFGKKSTTSTKVPHVIQFSQDVGGGPVTAMLTAGNPFANFVSPTTTLVLPATPELLGCGASGGSWGPYAGTWTGYLAIEGGGTSSTLTFYSSDSFGTPFVMAVTAATTVQKVGSSTVLTFSNASMIAKQDKFPLVIIRPCATFSITATPV